MMIDMGIDKRRVIDQVLGQDPDRSSSREDLVEDPLQDNPVSKSYGTTDDIQVSIPYKAPLRACLARSILGNNAEVSPAGSIPLSKFSQVDLQSQ